MVNFPSPAAASAADRADMRSKSLIERQLDLIKDALASGNPAEAHGAMAALDELQGTLQTSSGLQARANNRGGVEYRANYMLDSVLLADNLRMIHAQDSDLLETVVRQPL